MAKETPGDFLPCTVETYEGAWVAVTPHGVLPRDSHEISPTIGGGTQVDDLTKGFSKGNVTKDLRRRNGGGSGGPRPPYHIHGLLRGAVRKRTKNTW